MNQIPPNHIDSKMARMHIEVLNWIRKRRTLATFFTSIAVIGIFTLAIGKYFSHLTNKRIIAQQTSKLLINKGLLVAEVENARGDLKFIEKTLFDELAKNKLTPFEIYQQHETYLTNFVNSQRSFSSLAWREQPTIRKGLLRRNEVDKFHSDHDITEQDQSILTIFHPISMSTSLQRSQGLELSLSIAKVLNPPSSELPYKKPRCFLIVDHQGHTRYDSLKIHDGHDHQHLPLSSSQKETERVSELINQATKGSYKDSTGSWQWTNIKLNAEIDGVKTPGNNWTLVSHVPPIVFQNATRGHLFPLGIGSLVVFGLIILPLSFLSDFINSKRKKLLTEQSWQASHDGLTGCINRRAGLELLEKRIEASKIFEQIYALLFIDVDHLSHINNSYGHSIGDKTLIKICERIKKSVRSNDDLIRMGGDEFIVSLNDIGSPDNASHVANKILNSCNFTLPLDNTIVPVSVSIGIAVTSPNTKISNEKIIEAADISMLEAKQRGRNQFTLIDLQADQNDEKEVKVEREDSPKHRQKSIKNELELALKNNLFELYYQPIFNQEKKMVGAEALLRLTTSDKQNISPGIFIPIAEQNGLMPAIGHWVIQTAFEQVRQWKKQGLKPPIISINLSTTQLENQKIENQNPILRIAEKYCMPGKDLQPKDFKFEITETTTFTNAADAIGELKNLSRMGFKISIDDFGAGFASLERLRGFPANEIKLDKDFTKNVVENQLDSSLVKAVTHLAKDLNMNLVAEGVENLEQFIQLCELGCDLFQGYLFEKPLPALQFANRYLRHNARRSKQEDQDPLVD